MYCSFRLLKKHHVWWSLVYYTTFLLSFVFTSLGSGYQIQTKEVMNSSIEIRYFNEAFLNKAFIHIICTECLFGKLQEHQEEQSVWRKQLTIDHYNQLIRWCWWWKYPWSRWPPAPALYFKSCENKDSIKCGKRIVSALSGTGHIIW